MTNTDIQRNDYKQQFLRINFPFVTLEYLQGKRYQQFLKNQFCHEDLKSELNIQDIAQEINSTHHL